MNQAFEILRKAGGAQAARIILQNKKKISRLRVFLMARQLRRSMPVAKIIGEKWFYGLKFHTTRHTLDPRPDSETLVEAVLKNKKQKIILDMGTGTGCLICSIVKNMPGTTGVGIDKSFAACRIARKNVKDLGLQDKIKIIRSDFTNHKSSISGFDIIISNPPYIATSDNRVDAGALHDPKIALFAGADGLDAYRAIAKNAKNWLRAGGKIFLEIGAGQGNAVRKIFTGAGWRFVASYKDLGSIERVLEFSLV
ncbi:MAG: peptide chain release factor N(5)-glutamine methyltransferase [Alphaproteobacteria bacterium]|nr:peptide chain release factor N(5)-glutamine methyltransferase [Alphaproteobacteria bacterium]